MVDASLHLPSSFLHKAFSDRSGVPPGFFELYYRGKQLEGTVALSNWGVEKDSTIEVKMRGRGGMTSLGWLRTWLASWAHGGGVEGVGGVRGAEVGNSAAAGAGGSAGGAGIGVGGSSGNGAGGRDSKGGEGSKGRSDGKAEGDQFTGAKPLTQSKVYVEKHGLQSAQNAGEEVMGSADAKVASEPELNELADTKSLEFYGSAPEVEGPAAAVPKAAGPAAEAPQAVPSGAETAFQRSRLAITLDRIKVLDERTTAASVNQDNISMNEFHLIKARTMYQMVDEIDGGAKSLLFLTNPQAELIARSPMSLQKMLEALEVPKPSLVINLLCSCGFGDFTREFNASSYLQSAKKATPGVVGGRPPFADRAEECEAEGRIDSFMMDVLIPLAASTRAIVICSAMPSECILTASFTRMFSVARSKWGSRVPFTILSTTNYVEACYRNPDPSAYWHTLRTASRAWTQRDAKLLAVSHSHSQEYHQSSISGNHDLDLNATCYLITDNIDPTSDKHDWKPYNMLLGALLRYLSSTLGIPTIAMKTGMTHKFALGFSSKTTLAVPAELVQSGIPVLFLDVRKRQPLKPAGDALTFSTRAELVKAGRTAINEFCEQLLGMQPQLAESFDVCTLAYMHKTLTDSSDAFTTKAGALCVSDNVTLAIDESPVEVARPALPVSVPSVSLHEAIRRARGVGEQCVSDEESMQRASTDQVAEAATWLSQLTFSNAWQLLDDKEKREAQKESHDDLFKGQIYAHSTYARTLLQSPHMYNANVHDIDDISRLVDKLVRLDRLPQSNPLEGLLLLRSAWMDYDVTMRLADRYKCACKVIFATQLLLGWIIVTTTVISAWAGRNGTPESSFVVTSFVFGISVTIILFVSIEGLLDPKGRWRHLRSSASALQRLIWQYRTRVSPFEVDESRRDGTDPEETLCLRLNEWRDQLIDGASVNLTNLKQKHPRSVFIHYQDDGMPPAGSDDFQSPTQPTRYIVLRVEPMMAFYEQRIPVYTRRAFILKLVVVLLSIAASALAHFDQLTWVASLSGLAGAITSWSEFSDTTRKIERYSRSAIGLEKLLSWWDSLSEVRKASKEVCFYHIGRILYSYEDICL